MTMGECADSPSHRLQKTLPPTPVQPHLKTFFAPHHLTCRPIAGVLTPKAMHAPPARCWSLVHNPCVDGGWLVDRGFSEESAALIGRCNGFLVSIFGFPRCVSCPCSTTASFPSFSKILLLHSHRIPIKPARFGSTGCWSSVWNRRNWRDQPCKRSDHKRPQATPVSLPTAQNSSTVRPFGKEGRSWTVFGKKAAEAVLGLKFRLHTHPLGDGADLHRSLLPPFRDSARLFPFGKRGSLQVAWTASP